MARGPKRAMTQEMKAYLCEQMAMGRSVSTISADPDFNVEYRTINRELHRDPYFMAEYARAREAGVEPKIEEIEDILVGRGDWATVPWEARKEIANDRRWNAIRLQRFRYGDKVDINATVKHVEGKVIDAEVLDLDQLIAVREALAAAIEGPVEYEEEEYEDVNDTASPRS